MNAELESYLAAARTVAATPEAELGARQRQREQYPEQFLGIADSTLIPILGSAAHTLQKHSYGATVEVVRERSGGDPNSFPYVTLHFSPRPCPAGDLGYVYTIAGASVTFICRRDDLCVEVQTAHPAGAGVERRVNFCTQTLSEMTPQRVSQLVTDAVKQVIKARP